MVIGLLKNFVKTRHRPKPSRINSQRTEAYIPLPCGGVGNHIDPDWWEEKVYQDDDDSLVAQASRLKEARRLESENAEQEKEAIELRERLEKGYRVHGCDQLERPVSTIAPCYSRNDHLPMFMDKP